jgi:hypothetical protein
MENVKRRPGRPRKHETKLVPITGYVLPTEWSAVISQVGDTGSIGDWVRDAIVQKLTNLSN